MQPAQNNTLPEKLTPRGEVPPTNSTNQPSTNQPSTNQPDQPGPADALPARLTRALTGELADRLPR